MLLLQNNNKNIEEKSEKTEKSYNESQKSNEGNSYVEKKEEEPDDIKLEVKEENMETKINKKELEAEIQNKEKNKEKEKNKNLEQLFFYIFSTLSATFIIIINRVIFTTFVDITSNKVKIILILVYAGSFILSLPFYVLYSSPLINKQIKKKIEIINSEFSKKKRNKSIKISQINKLNDSVHLNPNNNEEILNMNKNNKINILNQDSKSEIYHSNLNIEKFPKKVKIDNKDSIKVCTCLGYLFFQKKIRKKNIYIFYDYNSCFCWFYNKIKKPDILYPFLILLLLQFSVVGFNSMLSDKMLNEYTFYKNKLFFFNLLLSVVYISIYIIFIRGIKFALAKKNKKKFNFCYLYFNDLFILVYFLLLFSFCSFVYSILYFTDKFPKGEKLEN